MSHCANYILVQDGTRRMGNSRWGSKSLPGALAYGPKEGLAFLREALGGEDENGGDGHGFVYGELMCEGAVLADFDQRRLLVYGGEDLRSEKPLQHAYLSLVRCAWEGWRVDWAHGGWPEIAAAAGVELDAEDPSRASALDAVKGIAPKPRRWTRGPDGTYGWIDDPDAWTRPIEPSMLYFNRGGPHSVVTVRDASGHVRHYQLDSHELRVLATGPTLVELLGEERRTPLVPASNAAMGGLLIDEAAKRVVYWLGREVPSWLPARIQTAWAGWEVERQDGGLPRQLELAGDDPAIVAIPPSVLREAVVRLIMGDSGEGIASIVEEIRARAAQPNVTVAAGATELPPAGTLSREDRAAYLAALLVRLGDQLLSL